MTVNIAIPVDDRAARQLHDDPLKRAALGRLISQWFDPEDQVDRLLGAIDRLSAHAEATGLTEALLSAELAAHKRERQA